MNRCGRRGAGRWGRGLGVAGLIAAILGAAPARATVNLVQNGTFTAVTNGAPADWQWTRASLWFFAGVEPGGLGVGNEALAGTNFFMFGSGNNDILSQYVATTPGQTYDFSFFLSAADDGPNGMIASFGNTIVLNQHNLTASRNAANDHYTEYSFDVTASAASTLISFAGYDDPAWIQLDSVSLVPLTTISSGASLQPAIPETPSWELALPSLALLVLLRRARRAYCRRG